MKPSTVSLIAIFIGGTGSTFCASPSSSSGPNLSRNVPEQSRRTPGVLADLVRAYRAHVGDEQRGSAR